MTEKKSAALRRRILPFTPLDLMLEEQGGGFYRVELKLAFNMNAGAAIQEKTMSPEFPDGLMLTDYKIWSHIGEPRVLRAMLWGAVLAHHPEYDTGNDEGLETIGSFIQEDNSDAIVEALWKAYLAFVPPAKREQLAKAKAEAEKTGAAQVPGKGSLGESGARPLDVKVEISPGTPANVTISAGSNSGPLPATTSESDSANSGD